MGWSRCIRLFERSANSANQHLFASAFSRVPNNKPRARRRVVTTHVPHPVDLPTRAQWPYVGRPARTFVPFMGKRLGCIFWPGRVLARRGFTVTGNAIAPPTR